MKTLEYFLTDTTKHKAKVHQLNFIGEFLQEKAKNRVFIKLDSIYTDYFPEYSKYFVRALRLLNSVYGMTKSGKLFADELTEWLLEAGFIKHQCHMTIYYKYAPDGTKTFVFPYVDDRVYWYTSEALGKWFVDNLGKRFHVNFLVYENWFMLIRIYQMKDHSIYVDQDRYATSIVARYLYTATVKARKRFIRPHCHLI